MKANIGSSFPITMNNENDPCSVTNKQSINICASMNSCQKINIIAQDM